MKEVVTNFKSSEPKWAWSRAVPIVKRRSGGRCEAKTRACTRWGQHVHHKQMRSHGSNHNPTNLLHVCEPCHTYLHNNPTESYDAGWLIRGVS